MENKDINLEVYLSDPKVQNRRIKLQHILGSVILLLMGTAFIFYVTYPFLRLIGIISVATALLVLYFLWPRNTGKLIRNNIALRWIEIGSFILLAVGFFMIRENRNGFFMVLLSFSYLALMFFEKRTSNVRNIEFLAEGIKFSSFNKQFFFKKSEVSLIKFKGKELTLRFDQNEFLNFQLVEEPNSSSVEYLEKDYLNG